MCWKSAPSAAVPVAMPTWRKVELIPEPMPARCGGTTLTAVDASGALTSAMPMPATMKPASSAVHSEEADSPRISSRAIATSSMPPPMRARIGTRADSRPASGATTNDSSESGRKRTPAWSGDSPSPFCR